MAAVASGQIDRAVLDETGTLTAGKPKVVELAPADGVGEQGLLRLSAAAEDPAEHTLARAVVDAANDRGMEIPDARDFASGTGQGVTATVEGRSVRVGKPDWAGVNLGALAERRAAMEARAQTVIALAADGGLLGLVGIADEVKPDAREAVERLRSRGVEVVMITGDNERTARAVAEEVGIRDLGLDGAPESGGDREQPGQSDALALVWGDTAGGRIATRFPAGSVSTS